MMPEKDSSEYLSIRSTTTAIPLDEHNEGNDEFEYNLNNGLAHSSRDIAVPSDPFRAILVLPPSFFRPPVSSPTDSGGSTSSSSSSSGFATASPFLPLTSEQILDEALSLVTDPSPTWNMDETEANGVIVVCPMMSQGCGCCCCPVHVHGHGRIYQHQHQHQHQHQRLIQQQGHWNEDSDDDDDNDRKELYP